MKYYYAMMPRRKFIDENFDTAIPSIEFGEWTVSVFDLYPEPPKGVFNFLGKKILVKFEVDDTKLTQAQEEIISNNLILLRRPLNETISVVDKHKNLNTPRIVPAILVAQIMPNYKERTKEVALREEAQVAQAIPNDIQRAKIDTRRDEKYSPKAKKDNPLRMAATKIAQKVIDYRERNIGKEPTTTKPPRKF